MAKNRGSYLGGSTVIRGEGVHPVRCFKQPAREVRSGVGPEREKKKRLERERDNKARAEARAHINANEKLLLTLGRQWRDAAGRNSIQKPTADQHHAEIERVPIKVAGESPLARALEAVFAKQSGEN